MRARRARTALVQKILTWGPEPIGANSVDAQNVIQGLELSGMMSPAGWGAAGSLEGSTSELFESPQAFAGGTSGALATLHTGNGAPIIYTADAEFYGLTYDPLGPSPTAAAAAAGP